MTGFRSILEVQMPLPGGGQTAIRHRKLMETGRRDLALARLAEAHWDAVAILAEAGREAEAGALYGVWASEIAGQALGVDERGGELTISGSKMFCSGAGLIDRALLTVGIPEQALFDVDLRKHADTIEFDGSVWKTSAFRATQTAKVTFVQTPVAVGDQVGASGWYLERPGFWHGACGPAACWRAVLKGWWIMRCGSGGMTRIRWPT